MRTWIKAAALAALLPLGACDADEASPLGDGGPEPGTMVVRVTSPFGADGAVSFELRGPGVENVRATDGVEVFATPLPDGVRVAVVGEEVSGEMVRFDVPDLRMASEYEVRLIEVADTHNELRRDLSGYLMALSPR